MCIQQLSTWYHYYTVYGWNKMSWVWRSTDEARVKSNTYSCKTGSLCDSGQSLADNSTHSAANTHRVTMVGNWPTGNERNTVRWAKIRKPNNRKLQLISADSIRKSRDGSSCGCVPVITEAWVTRQKQKLGTDTYPFEILTWFRTW